MSADVMGLIYGFRYWGLDNAFTLRGLTFPQKWVPGDNTAHCLRMRTRENPTMTVPANLSLKTQMTYADDGTVTLPDDSMFVWSDTCRGPAKAAYGTESCNCGFYASKSPVNGGFGPPAGLPVAGVVAGWGDIEFGSEGFRCARARVVALMVDDALASGILSRHYAVPAYTSIPSMVQAHPLTDLAGLRTQVDTIPND